MQVSEFLAKVEQGQRDFRNVSLRKANLHSAQLPLLNLDGADLEGADLTNANLAGSSLSHAQLGKAKLSGANLLGSQCFKTYFREADLSNALLSGADLQGCDFKQADLSKASCVGVDLSGANLRYAKLNHANLKAAKLKGTDLYGANTEGTDLEGADVADIIWPDGTEQLLIDEEVPADSPDPSSGGTEQSPSSLAATLPQDPSQPVQSEPQESMRFGDFDLERQDQFSTFSTTSFQQAQNLAQQRSLKLASQIASRLDRQVEYRFKKAVRSSYGDRCALSKSTISTLLETVVIFPDVESDRDHPSNGLLLRIDLARLFKVNLITIHPKTYRVILAPSLQKSEYAGFAGAKLRLPSESSHHPNSNCLQAHFDQCDWIVSEQEEKLETSSEAIETSPLSDAKPSRFVQLSKLWLKRIQEVLHTPINPSLARSKPSLEHGAELEDHTSASGELEAIVEDSIVPDVAVEHPLETKEINLVPESSVGDVSPDEEESSTSDSSGEFIAFSPIETAEDQEESSVEMDSLPKPPPLIKNRPSFLPFPAPPPHFRPSSVTRKLDRLQDELDKISQELEPYLPSTEPIEDVSVLIDTIEKELQESVPSTIVDREFESLFGQKVNPPLPEDLSEASEDLEVSSEAEDLTADQSVETTPPIN
ncbi:MAG: pentapeptide repeat-containing protein, partial [Prochlorotrichaceae cyanobacterium]